MLAGKHGAEKVDVEYALKCFCCNLFQRCISAFHADPDIVVKNVEATPFRSEVFDREF